MFIIEVDLYIGKVGPLFAVWEKNPLKMARNILIQILSTIGTIDR